MLKHELPEWQYYVADPCIPEQAAVALATQMNEVYLICCVILFVDVLVFK